MPQTPFDSTKNQKFTIWYPRLGDKIEAVGSNVPCLFFCGWLEMSQRLISHIVDNLDDAQCHVLSEVVLNIAKLKAEKFSGQYVFEMCVDGGSITEMNIKDKVKTKRIRQ